MSQSPKRRPCPAVQRPISSGECGENRISHYPCPADCPFNPFSLEHYEQYLEIEVRTGHKSLEWYADRTPDPAAAWRQLARLDTGPMTDRLAFEIHEIFLKRDAHGRTCSESWEAAGFPGLKNDERVVHRAAMKLRLSLVEIHRVIDHQQMEVVDLLEPDSKPFVIVDRSLASQALRFMTMLCWVFPMPHYGRILRHALQIRPAGNREPDQVLQEVIRHLGGPAERPALGLWLAQNFATFTKAMEAVALARRQKMFEALDAEFGKAVYELRASPAECRGVLDRVKEVRPDQLSDAESDEGFEEARVWLDSEPPMATASMGEAVLGRVLLRSGHWRVEAMGGRRLKRLRELVEEILGDRVKFAGERRDDLGAQMQGREPQFDPALVPPRLLENTQSLVLISQRISGPGSLPDHERITSETLRHHEHEWLDQNIPALNGRTPREAARDPNLRPPLLRLLKERIQDIDRQNRQTGGSDDGNWMLLELGAHDLVFDPPPARPRPPKASDPEDNLSPFPPLPFGPLTHAEAEERLSRAQEEFSRPDEIMDALGVAGRSLLDSAGGLVGPMLSENEHALLTISMVSLWFAFVPTGYHGPTISGEELRTSFGALLDRSESKLTPAIKLDEFRSLFIHGCPQPAMMEKITELTSILSQDAYGPPGKNLIVILLLLRATLDLLDAKCRHPSHR